MLAREVPNYAEAKGAFAKLLNLRMGADQAGKPEPIKVPLEAAAENVLEEFARKMQRDGKDASGPYAGSLGKARGHAMRLAAVIEYLWWSASGASLEPATISQKAMAAAADLMNVYFLPMAERVFKDAAIPEAEKGAAFVAKYLRKHGVTQFNSRDLRRKISGPVREGPPMDAACEVLETAGMIRLIPTKKPGRSRKDYDVNPAVFGASSPQ